MEREERQGQGVIDPRDQFAQAPKYEEEHLPKIFVDYTSDSIASWGGDRGAYASAFMAMHCGVLHSSVKMNTNPLKPNNFRNPNDFSLTLGKSGENKSGMFKDLTRHQTEWQRAMSRAQTSAVSKRHPPMCFLQNASVEGLMLQIADNKGDRLLMGSEEAMGFYEGAAIHHRENASRAVSDAVCTIYDGGMYSKRLVSKSYSIPECLATLVMTTTIDKITGWKAFAAMVDSGMMARHTIGVLAHVEERDPSKVIAGADAAMGDMLLKMRGLRDVHLALSGDVAESWLSFTAKQEKYIGGMVLDGKPEGLVNWMRKYDMRIMTMATILQLYEYIEGGQMGAKETVIPATEADVGKADAGVRVMKQVSISRDNLERAIKFVNGYLLKTQEHFYTIAAGVTEFGKELMNFIAYRVTTDDPDEPELRIMSRDDITFRGPAICRGAITPTLKETHKRWIQALLDHGFIEVYDHPRARPLKQRRLECEERWYKLRDEVFHHFADSESKTWLRAHWEAYQTRGQPKRGEGESAPGL